MLRNVSIGNRIIFLITSIVIFTLITGAALLWNTLTVKDIGIQKVNELMLEGQKAKLKVASDSIATSLSKIIADAQTETERIEIIRKALNDIRFEEDDSGYYFVFEGTKTIAHAAKPSLHGKDLGSLKDKNGVFMIRELSDIAHKGGGFVQYIWAKPEAGDQPKLSYATLIPGTNYTLGTGVYIDNIAHEEALISTAIDATVRHNTLVILGGLTAALLGLILPLSLYIVRSITRPISEATNAAKEIADGNYDVELDARGKDEAAMLEKALNTMATTLRDNIKEISAKTKEAEEKAQAAEKAMAEADEARAEADQARKTGTRQAAERIQTVVDKVQSASEMISSQARIIDEGTTIQRDRVQGTATAMEEMNATVLEVARNASEASAMGNEAKDKAIAGAEIVSRSVGAMNTTYKAAEGLQDGMNRLGEQTEAIGKVMNVITDIADQTNLLALNAAIEAARAGEAGRGFAVVADEVRKLAEKTMQATKEVGDSIAAVQQVAHQNITGMGKALSDLTSAADLSNQSGEVLKEIVQGVEESAIQIHSIATAAEEQSAASEEINMAIDEINSISAETSQGVTEAVNALRELASQTEELQAVIDNLIRDAQ
ncbi:methyl-accepting chemotaxis protein [Pseudodesulfovibrio sp. zrk46]|uniref:methyl-accepting chemotaxis protein n=1 Tax=Pseudodesulfovibrio sp. zrk46 TaxID=2725288 RepID=UPI001448EA3C|nr:methyl-accepting chemotaxis protein [Pseudodesulfovibrio sp. zrk46]QJB57155.1 HAMP domain-containing protein [Pseudodesulfovibrio sp. zrk46]